MKKRSIQRLAVVVVALLLFNLLPLSVFAAEEGHWELVCTHSDACDTCDQWVDEVPETAAVIDLITGLTVEDAVAGVPAHCSHQHDAQGPDSSCWLWIPAEENPGEKDPVEPCAVEGCLEGANCPTHSQNADPGEEDPPKPCTVEGCLEGANCPTHSQNPEPNGEDPLEPCAVEGRTEGANCAIHSLNPGANLVLSGMAPAPSPHILR